MSQLELLPHELVVLIASCLDLSSLLALSSSSDHLSWLQGDVMRRARLLPYWRFFYALDTEQSTRGQTFKRFKRRSIAVVSK